MLQEIQRQLNNNAIIMKRNVDNGFQDTSISYDSELSIQYCFLQSLHRVEASLGRCYSTVGLLSLWKKACVKCVFQGVRCSWDGEACCLFVQRCHGEVLGVKERTNNSLLTAKETLFRYRVLCERLGHIYNKAVKQKKYKKKSRVTTLKISQWSQVHFA